LKPASEIDPPIGAISIWVDNLKPKIKRKAGGILAHNNWSRYSAKMNAIFKGGDAWF
jgi:hypothetical protein